VGYSLSSVVAFRTNEVPKDFASLQAKLETYQRGLREWSGYLTGNEIAITELLIDRTIGWGRREAYFTIRALIAGDSVYSGLLISRRTCFRVLSSLETKGLIRRRKDPNVPDRVHFTVNLDWKPDMVAVPKRLQGRCQDDTARCQPDTTRCQDGTLYTGINLQVSPTGNQPGAAAPVSSGVAEKVREIAKSSAGTNRARLAAKAASPQNAVEAVDAAWRMALIETFPGTAYRTWGVREKAQIKTVLKNWRGDCTFPEFVEWAVRNWTAIIKKHFKWMTKEPPPAAPALGFLIAFVGKFADARAEGVLNNWQSATERTAVERLMAQGQTWEQATEQLAVEKAAGGLRKEMEKREVFVRSRDHAATRKLAEAKRIAALEGRVPIHPKSVLARQMKDGAARPGPAKMVEVDGTAAETFEMIDMTSNPFDD
jgi:hypothetical protein